MQSKVFSTNKTLNIRDKLWDLSTPKVMGILNITPDSFHDGGLYQDEKSIVGHVQKMLDEGANIIDVGGHSTRPGAQDVSEAEELKRVSDAIRTIVKVFPDAILSVDTFRSSVARSAVDAGASLINDISGGELDEEMFDTVAALRVPYILMHFRGTPQTMTQLTQYDNLLKDVTDYFHQKLYRLHRLGVKDIIIDPGFGFAKTVEQNFELLNKLDYLQILGKPLLVGLSRKSMIWQTLETDSEGALNGSTALHTLALTKGASILRVHDVKEAVECIRLIGKLQKK